MPLCPSLICSMELILQPWAVFRLCQASSRSLGLKTPRALLATASMLVDQVDFGTITDRSAVHSAAIDDFANEPRKFRFGHHRWFLCFIFRSKNWTLARLCPQCHCSSCPARVNLDEWSLRRTSHPRSCQWVLDYILDSVLYRSSTCPSSRVRYKACVEAVLKLIRSPVF